MPRTLQPLPPQGRPHPESEQVLSQGISQQLSQRNANTARALATTMRAAVSSRPLLERAVARMPAASRINTREPWQTRLNRRGEGLALGIQNSRDAWGGEQSHNQPPMETTTKKANAQMSVKHTFTDQHQQLQHLRQRQR